MRLNPFAELLWIPRTSQSTRAESVHDARISRTTLDMKLHVRQVLVKCVEASIERQNMAFAAAWGCAGTGGALAAIGITRLGGILDVGPLLTCCPVRGSWTRAGCHIANGLG